MLIAYLHTVKLLCDFGSVFHFKQCAQVASSVVQLYLKAFVSKCNFTGVKDNKLSGIIKNNKHQ